jgi:tight adherence protein B
MTRRRWAAALLVLLTVVLGVGSGAQAQEAGSAPGEAPNLPRAVDARSQESHVLQIMTTSPDGIEMTQRGEQVSIEGVAPLGESRPFSLVVIVDVGESMQESGGLEAARQGLLQIVESLGAGNEMSIVQAGDQSRPLAELTSSPGRLRSAIETLSASPQGGSAIWTSVRVAADALEEAPSSQPNVLILTSAQNINDGGERSAALGDLQTAGSGAFVLGYGASFDGSTFNELVQTGGGAIYTGNDAASFQEGVATIIGWLTNDQYAVTFTPTVTERGEIAPTEVTVGGETIRMGYVAGNLDQGAAALAPFDTEEPDGVAALPFLQGSMGQTVVVAMVLVSVIGAVYALGLIFTKDEGALSNVLQPYSEGYGATDDDDDEGGSALARTALLQRAVSITEQVADSQGYLSKTESALERANLPLRAAEALFFYVLMVAVVAIVGLILLPPMGALVLVIIAVLVPPAIVNLRASLRKRQFGAQLPDMLQLLSGTLRAGYSLMQGVEAVSQEVAEPMGKELRRVVTEARLGRPLEQALDGVAERMASPDFAWAVMAIRIQREVGGNLSELLLTVSDTMIARERLRRDVQALTAEGRMSAIVLGALPVGLAAVMFTINPDYMGKLFNTTLGNILLGLALVAMGIGFVWMRQIIKIDI